MRNLANECTSRISCGGFTRTVFPLPLLHRSQNHLFQIVCLSERHTRGHRTEILRKAKLTFVLMKPITSEHVCICIFTLFSQFEYKPANYLGGSLCDPTCGGNHEPIKGAAFNFNYSFLSFITFRAFLGYSGARFCMRNEKFHIREGTIKSRFP